jgi:hypothetical protein
LEGGAIVFRGGNRLGRARLRNRGLQTF